MTAQEKADIEFLLVRPEFRRFLWRVIQMSGILRSANGPSESLDLAKREGRRSLGFEILEDVERGQPAPQAGATATIFAVLREEAQRQPEKPNAKRQSRHDEILPPDERDPD